MECTEVYLRHTDKKGNAWPACHRVWNKDLFLHTTNDAAVKEGGKVEAITEAEYQAERK